MARLAPRRSPEKRGGGLLAALPQKRGGCIANRAGGVSPGVRWRNAGRFVVPTERMRTSVFTSTGRGVAPGVPGSRQECSQESPLTYAPPQHASELDALSNSCPHYDQTTKRLVSWPVTSELRRFDVQGGAGEEVGEVGPLAAIGVSFTRAFQPSLRIPRCQVSA